MIRPVASGAGRTKALCHSARSGRAGVVFVAALLVILAGAALYVLNRAPDPPVVKSGGGTVEPAPTPRKADSEPASGDATESTTAASASAPPFDDWKSPAAVLVFTGEQHGYLEPCGCTAGQVGGLARRMDLVRLLREEKKWPLAAFDIGGLLRDERAKRPQEGIKFDTTRGALGQMGYEAQAIGVEELRFGADNLYALFSEEQGKGELRPKFVSANVTLYEERTDQYTIEIPEQYRIVDVGGVKVAVTSIVGADLWSRVFPGGATIDTTVYAFEEPGAALERVVPLMQAEQPDVMVLLAHSGVDRSRDLAAQFPVFHVVVTAGGPEDGRREPGLVNETLVLEVGQKGKAAGVVGVYTAADKPRLDFRLVELNGKDFRHAPPMHVLFDQYVKRLDAQHPALQEALGPHPSGAAFVGAESCKECHNDEYEIWAKSKHAHAFDSLTTGRPDAEDDDIFVTRTRDPECITCHATGWDPLRFGRYDGAFVDMETTPQLAGSQCENCHGPGSQHVDLERAWKAAGGAGEPSAEALAARQQLHLDVDVARENLCVHCHDIDNSPTFDTDKKPFDSYWWSQIAH